MMLTKKKIKSILCVYSVVFLATVLFYNILQNNYMILPDDISCHYSNYGDSLPQIGENFVPPEKSIHFHETSCKGRGLNSRQACSVESAARANPSWQIIVYFTGPLTNESLNSLSMRVLKKYSNIMFLRIHLLEFAKDTPLQDFMNDGMLNRSQWPVSHTSDALRFLTLYKWGGVYLDLDMIVARSFDKLAPNWASRQQSDIVESAVLAMPRDALGRSVAKAAIMNFREHFSGDSWGQNGPVVISRVLLKLCRTEIHDFCAKNCQVSSHGVAGIPGFLISSVLMGTHGRKFTHLFTILPGLVGYIIIYFAQNIPTIMIGRILGGFTSGATVGLGAIVIGEYSDPKYRGVFLNLKTAAVSFGSMVVHILSHFLTWRYIALIAVVPHLITFIIVITWPESPAWLASKGQFEKSEKAFYWLREKNLSSQREIRELINAQKTRLSKPMKTNSLKDNIKQCVMKFTKKDFLKPLNVVIVSGLVQEASGRHIFPAYGLQIINKLAGSKTQSFYFTLAIDLIITTSIIFSSILVKFMKRRTLLFSTGFLSFLALMIVCTCLALIDHNVIFNNLSWIPICMFVLYFILANLGCTPIPLALVGEVLPLPHRSVASCLLGILLSLEAFLAYQITPYMLLHIKVYGTFCGFGLVLGISLFILYFILPETKDKTLQEIENYFNYGRYENYETSRDDDEVKVSMLKQ